MTHRSEQRQKDLCRARELADAATDRNSQLYREYGPDILLRAAQVYATLAISS